MSNNLVKFMGLSTQKFLMTTWLSLSQYTFAAHSLAPAPSGFVSGFLIKPGVGGKCEAEEVSAAGKELIKYLVCCQLTQTESNSNQRSSCIIRTLSILLTPK